MSSASGDGPSLSKAWPLGNEAFLRAVFEDRWEDAHVCAVAGDPTRANPADWAGGKARSWLRHLAAGTNNYFAVSTFCGDRRIESAFAGLWVLGIDDVGPKINAQTVLNLLGEPTYRIETSPGNEQWGYRLAVPIIHLARAKALQRAVRVALTGVDGRDPGQEHVTRYMRLPVGMNRKGSGSQVRQTQWSARLIPEAEVELWFEQLGVPGPDDPSWDKSVGTKTHRLAANSPGGPGRPGDAVLEEDLLLRAMRELDLVLGQARDSAMGTGFDVRCPWGHEHTDRGDTGTFFAPGRGFRCHHGHCDGKGLPDLPGRLDEMLREDSGGLACLGALDFDEVDPASVPVMRVASRVTRAEPVRAAFRLGQTVRTHQPRDWIARGLLLRGAVSMLFGPANQGKSLMLTMWSVALATGTAWGTLQPARKYRVLTLFSEEDNEEQSRRVGAAAQELFADLDEVDEQLDRLECMGVATLFAADQDRALVPTKAWGQLVQVIRERRPDVLILDPLIELHNVEENDNTLLKGVIARLRALAQHFGLAVLLSHHTRKAYGEGGGIAGVIDAARGASAIGGAVRIAHTLVEMTEQEAGGLGIPVDRRRYYVRLDEARNTFTPPARVADWFEKVSHALPGSGTETSPALRCWAASPAVAPNASVLGALVQGIAAGCPATGGMPWSPVLRPSEPRSVVHLLRAHGVEVVSDRVTLDALFQAGVVAGTFRHPSHRHPANGLRTAHQGPAGVVWADPT
jgi:hypothetical protein